jgi:quercetin dioxygenase-like cupin family protein
MEFPMRPNCTATQLVADDRVIVTRFDFAPGAETGWHRHGHDSSEYNHPEPQVADFLDRR